MPKDIMDIRHTKRTKKANNVVPFKKKKNRKKPVFIFFLFIVVACTLLFTPIFNIKTIEVFGNQKYTQQEIVDMSKIIMGQNIFKVNYIKVKENYLSNEYIEKVKISRHYPNKIKIIIDERKPAGYLEFVGTSLIIDKNGISLEVLNSINHLKIPNITGINFSDYKLGRVVDVKQEDKAKFDCITKCLNEIATFNLINKVDKIDITTNKLIIWIYDERYQVNLVDAEQLDYKFKMLTQEIIPNLEDTKSPSGIIDFTIVKKPTFKPI